MDELLAISFIAIGAGLACGFALNIWAMMVLMLLVTVELMDFWLEGIASVGGIPARVPVVDSKSVHRLRVLRRAAACLANYLHVSCRSRGDTVARVV